MEIISSTRNVGPIYCIGLYRKENDLSKNLKNQEFRQILEQESNEYPQIKYMNGYDLLSSYQGLSIDGLHPSDFGHDLIASSLSKKI